jgi:thymidylate synthase (FAD)
MTTPFTSISLLDHGYVSDLAAWGSDEFIVETARVSTQKGFLGWGKPVMCPLCDGKLVDGSLRPRPCSYCQQTGKVIGPAGDEKLLRYLYEHAHSTPFEFAGLTLEIQAPIFVFREWHRHRVQAFSEASARYTPLPNLNYIPTVERLMMTGGANKQAGTVRGADALTEEHAILERIALTEEYAACEVSYQRALSRGVPKELARIRLPVGRYSKMRATANLRNWLAFLTLRQAPGAQYEIRVYADAVGEIIAERFPRTWELFSEKR